jgi:hypothetical protein
MHYKPEYCKSIEKLITKYQHKFKEQSNLDILWDNFKLEVRDKTIAALNSPIETQCTQMTRPVIDLIKPNRSPIL